MARDHPGNARKAWGALGEGKERWIESPDPQYARKKGFQIG